MSWSYLTPSTVVSKDDGFEYKKQRIRFLVNDVYQENQLISDEEIDFAVEVYPAVFQAASLIANTISIQFGRKGNASLGEAKLTYIDQAEQYRKLAQELWDKSVKGSSSMVVKFIEEGSASANGVDTGDTTRIFSIGMHNNNAG